LDNIKILTPSSNKSLGKALRKTWRFRNLIYTFTIRDIVIQYAQTRVGVLWSLVQAISAALIINLFFGNLLNVTVPQTPYIIFAFPGIMSWYFFSYIITSSGTSLIQSQHIIKKIYFPKFILPLYKTFVGLFDFLLWFLFYIFLLIYYKQGVSINIIFLPFCILLNIITGLSVAIWLSALTVRYRDFLHIIPYLIGFGILVTPVFFPTLMIPEAYKFLIYINPMAGVIAFYRWCILDINFSLNYLIGFIPVIVLFITGLFYFKEIEGTIPDFL